MAYSTTFDELRAAPDGYSAGYRWDGNYWGEQGYYDAPGYAQSVYQLATYTVNGVATDSNLAKGYLGYGGRSSAYNTGLGVQ
jgi:hypothetical protein